MAVSNNADEARRRETRSSNVMRPLCHSSVSARIRQDARRFRRGTQSRRCGRGIEGRVAHYAVILRRAIQHRPARYGIAESRLPVSKVFMRRLGKIHGSNAQRKCRTRPLKRGRPSTTRHRHILGVNAAVARNASSGAPRAYRLAGTKTTIVVTRAELPAADRRRLDLPATTTIEMASAWPGGIRRSRHKSLNPRHGTTPSFWFRRCVHN